MLDIKERLAQNHSAANDFSIWNGWSLVHDLSNAYDLLIKSWFENIPQEDDSDKILHIPENSFALVSLGGYGRGELNKNSDLDIGLLVDSSTSNGDEAMIVKRVAESRLYDLVPVVGREVDLRVLNEDSINRFALEDLNTTLDMRLISGQEQVLGKFRRKIVERYDKTMMNLHNIALWESLQKKHGSLHDLSKFNIKYGLGGLRNFNVGAWFECIDSFGKSTEAYSLFDRDLLESAGVIFKIRSWLNFRKEYALVAERSKDGKTPYIAVSDRPSFDVMEKEDFLTLPVEARERFMEARVVISQSTKARINQKIRNGIRLENRVSYTRSGLRANLNPGADTSEINDAFGDILRISQERGIPIDNSEFHTSFRNPSVWFDPLRNYANFFYTQGKVSATLDNLVSANLNDKVFPGHARIKALVSENGNLTLLGEMFQKFQTLDSAVESVEETEMSREFKLLDPQTQAALNYAITICDVSDTDSVMKVRNDFSISTSQVASFLVKNKTILLNMAVDRLSDSATIAELVDICASSKEKLRSLYIFSDLNSRSDSQRVSDHIWSNAREIYHKALLKIDGGEVRERTHLTDDVHEKIIEDLGPDFIGSRQYAHLLPKLIPRILEVSNGKKSSVKELSASGDSRRISVVATDYPGLIAAITGTCYSHEVLLKKLHAFTMSQRGIAVDFIDLSPPKRESSILSDLEKAIADRTFIDVDPNSILSRMEKKVELKYLESSGHYRLRLDLKEDGKGIAYAISKILYDQLGANIYGMHSDLNPSGGAINVVFFQTPRSKSEVDHLVKSI